MRQAFLPAAYSFPPAHLFDLGIPLDFCSFNKYQRRALGSRQSDFHRSPSLGADKQSHHSLTSLCTYGPVFEVCSKRLFDHL